MSEPTWTAWRPRQLRDRLASVQQLLGKAAAVGLAQDLDRVRELQKTQSPEEEPRGERARRSYR